MLDSVPLLHGDNLYNCDYPSCLEFANSGMSVLTIPCSALPTHFVASSFCLLLCKTFPASLQVILKNSISVVNFDTSLGGFEFKVFLCYHLGYLLKILNKQLFAPMLTKML